MALTTRARPLTLLEGNGIQRTFGTEVLRPYAFFGHQITLSEGHPWPHGKGDGDVGGPFSTRRNYMTVNHVEVAPYTGPSWDSDSNYAYRGPQFARATDAIVSDFPVVTFNPVDVWGRGATAIARVAPTNPNAGLATFIGELKEGLPSLIGLQSLRSRALAAKKAGSEYLNVEFGWKPLVNDVQKFARAVRNRETVMRQFERNSGRHVRRRYKFPDITSENVTTLAPASPVPGLVTQLYQEGYAVAPATRIQRVTYSDSFSGAFVYHLNVGNTPADKRDRWFQDANHLLGIRITPEVLWDLAPWSWAADWFANTGDVFRNLSLFTNDGLVMEYGYIMRQIVSEDIYTLGPIRYTNVPGEFYLEQTFGTIVKTRTQASPFGFGLNPDVDFTPRQWAISAAVGSTRRR